MNPTRMSPAERELRSRLAQTLRTVELLHATPNPRRVRCGKPGCRCADGEPHPALYVVSRRDGRTRQLYVPKTLESCALEWVRNYDEVLELLEKISALYWERLRTRDV